MAVVEFSVGGLEGIVVEEVAVVNGDDLAGAAGGEVNHGSTVRDHGAVSIDEGHGCVGYVVPARTEDPSVGGKNEMVGLEGGTEFVLSDDFAVGAGDGFDGTWFERDLIGDDLTWSSLRCLLAASERAWTAFTGFTLNSVSTHGEAAGAAKVSAISFAGASPMPKLRRHSQMNSVA